MVYGRLLRANRDLLGLRRAELARQVGCSVGHLGNIERGSANPGPSFRERLAAALDMSIPAKPSEDDGDGRGD